MGDNAAILYEHQLSGSYLAVTGSSKQVTDLSHVYAILAVAGVLMLWEKPAGLQAHEMYNCGDPEGSAVTFIANSGSIILRGPF